MSGPHPGENGPGGRRLFVKSGGPFRAAAEGRFLGSLQLPVFSPELNP
jgi:hypothetical protein